MVLNKTRMLLLVRKKRCYSSIIAHPWILSRFFIPCQVEIGEGLRRKIEEFSTLVVLHACFSRNGVRKPCILTCSTTSPKLQAPFTSSAFCHWISSTASNFIAFEGDGSLGDFEDVSRVSGQQPLTLETLHSKLPFDGRFERRFRSGPLLLLNDGTFYLSKLGRTYKIHSLNF